MEISYDVKHTATSGLKMGGGCYTMCEVNVSYGASIWCCERIKSA